MSDIAKLVRGASVTLIGRATGRGLHVLCQVVLARLLLPSAFGIYALGWTLVRMGGLIAPLGLDAGVVRYGSQYWHRNPAALRKFFLSASSLAFVSGLLCGTVLYVTAPWLANYFFKKPDLVLVLRSFSPAFALYAALRVVAAATRVSQDMRYSVLAEDLVQPLSNLVLIALFHVVGFSLAGAVFAALGSFAASLILALRYLTTLLRGLPNVETGPTIGTAELLKYSVPASLAGVFVTLVVWADRIVVGYFMSADAVGVYQAASQISIIFALVLGSFNAIFAPMIADLHHEGHYERMHALFKISTKWSLFVSLPLFLCVILASESLIVAVYGPQYAAGSLPLIILAGGQLVNAATGAVGVLLVMTGNHRKWFTVAGVALAGSVVAGCVLVPHFGLIGAAAATSLSIAGLYIVGLFKVKRLLGLWPYDSRFLKAVPAAAASVASVLLMRTVMSLPLPVEAILTVFVTVGVFAASIFLMGLDQEDKQALRMVAGRFRN